jgi:hypothetical protein
MGTSSAVMHGLRIAGNEPIPRTDYLLLLNTSGEEMKVVCFLATATALDNYKIHEGVDFPE